MATIPEALNLAMQHHQAGRLPEAETLYRQILQVEPKHPDALHLLGLVAHHVGRHEPAVELMKQAIALNPAVADYHNNLGETYRALGRLEEATACYGRALALRSDFAEPHYNLGILLTDQGKMEDAIVHYRRAVACKPSYADAHNNLANLLGEQGKVEEALTHYRQALAHKPNFAEPYNNIGNVLKEQGKMEEALTHYRRALELKPDFVLAHNNLGVAMHSQGKMEEAEGHYRKALSLKPDFAEVYVNLGRALAEQGRTEEAIASYQKALEIKPAHGASILLASTLPVIADSRDHLVEARRRFTENLAGLLRRDLSLADPPKEVAATNFYLAYQGCNDRELLETLSRVYEQACPSLKYVAPHCQAAPAPAAGRKIKVGFISRMIGNHTITGVLMRGIIANLSRRMFSVSVLTFPHERNTNSEHVARSADRVVELPILLDAARRRIAEEQLDVLCYIDLGMEPLTYFLAFSRLAPVQCATWQHPVTTGIQSVDYFISSAILETEGADAHYSERLVRLKNLPAYYFRPEIPASFKSRRELGLDEGKTLYLCPQSLFKLHPDYDEFLSGVLAADPHGEVLLIEGFQKHWTTLLMRRFRKTIPEAADRIRILPRQTSQDFLNLLAVGDVILDPIYWSGGITTLDALALGTPIVTLPSEFMRGRVTDACYKQMGVMDCVVASKEEYVKLAVRLGTDQKYRTKVKAKILAANNVLYENAAAVRDMERFFMDAVERASTGSRQGERHG